MDEIEKLLKKAVLAHLSDEELAGYNDSTLDDVASSRVKAHLARCLICSRKLEFMQEMLGRGTCLPGKELADEITKDGQIGERSSLWKRYKEKIQSTLDEFQAGREAVIEWLADKGPEMSLEALIPVVRGGTRDAATSGTLKFTCTLGDPPPVYPLATPVLGSGPARYHSLIMLRPDRKDIVNLYENRPIGRSLHFTPEFEEEDLGTNELYLILSSEPLSIDDDEIELTLERFIDALDEAGDEGAFIFRIEMEVIRGKK